MLRTDTQRTLDYQRRVKQEKLAQAKKDRILAIALGEGIKYSTLSAMAFGGVSYGLTKYSPTFNKSMSISAKVSLPTMAFMFSFAFIAERTMSNVQRNPEAWGIYASADDEIASKNIQDANERERKTSYFHVPIHHYIANRINGS